MNLPLRGGSFRLVQVTPHDSGLRDYALVLDARFAEMGVDHLTIVTPMNTPRLVTPPGFEFTPNDILLLNFSGYSYSRNGLTLWLVRLMRELRRKRQVGGIMTFFHELHDDSPPWRRGFYRSFGHKYLCYTAQALSDRVFTNSAYHADRLQRFYLGRERATVLPVCSNVGEPAVLPPFEQRQAKAVIFGMGANRARGFKAFGGAAGIARLPVTEVVEIGLHDPVGEGAPGWRWLGELPPQEVSRHMLEARYGLVTHRPRNLTKSGVFAAYAAHGCIPIVPPVPGSEGLSDGLVSGRNAILLADLPSVREESLPALSQAIHQWYEAHDSRHAAETIVRAAADLVRNPALSAA